MFILSSTLTRERGQTVNAVERFTVAKTELKTWTTSGEIDRDEPGLPVVRLIGMAGMAV